MLEVLVLVVLGLGTCILLFYRHRYNHWSRRGVEQLQPVPVIGNIMDAVLNRKNIGFIYGEIYKKYSRDYDAVGMYEFQSPKLMIMSPELIRSVLVRDFSSFHDNQVYVKKKLEPFSEWNPFLCRGEEWKPARSSLGYGMSPNKVKKMFPLMMHSVSQMNAYLEDRLGEEVDARTITELFVVANVSNTVYGIDSNCFTDSEAMFRKIVELATKEYWGRWWQVLIIFHLPRIRYLLGYSFFPNKARHYLEVMVRKVAAAKLEVEMRRNDFFETYLRRRDRPDEENIREIIGHAITFSIAGMETSSIPASSTLYELAMNQQIQDKLYRELKEALCGGKEMDFETLKNLPYLEKVFSETMRKYPIVYSYSKVCTKHTTLNIDGKFVPVEPGIAVMVPVMMILHDPRYYPDPEVFDPERFTAEAIAARPQFTYMPFGEGPRICPGMIFGTSQVKLFLANLVYNYTLMPTANTPQKLSYSKTSFLPVCDVKQWIRLEKRQPDLQ